MNKRLYLDDGHLGFIRKSKEQTGEQQGGKYSARIQTGIEKDGSPQYRYFKTQAEYESYIAKQRKGGTDKKDGGEGKTESMKERLQSKLKKEQKESSSKTKDTSSKKVSGQHSRNRSLYAGSTASVKKFSVKKGLPLYLGEK